MSQKKLQKGSQYEKFDLDNNGTISDGEMAMAHKVEQLEHQRNMNENLDKMMDQQRWICWVSSVSSIFLIILCLLPIIPESRIDMCTALVSTYVIANLGIVSVFMGATAYSKKNGTSLDIEK